MTKKSPDQSYFGNSQMSTPSNLTGRQNLNQTVN